MGVKRSFTVAAIATFVVFSAGLFVQWNIDQARTADVLASIDDLRLTTNSVLTEKELALVFKDTECASYKDRTASIAGNVDRLGKTLETYTDSSIFNPAKYAQLKHEYTILEIFYWARLIEAKESCSSNDYATVLYFYRNDPYCAACDSQGVILTNLKKNYKDAVQIFSIDTNMAAVEPTVKLLTDHYNVTEPPVIVLDKATVLRGLIAKDALGQKINELHG